MPVILTFFNTGYILYSVRCTLNQTDSEVTFQIRVTRLVIFRPNFRNVAAFQVDWPKKFNVAFGLFCFISSWLAIKIRLVVWLFFDLVTLK